MPNLNCIGRILVTSVFLLSGLALGRPLCAAEYYLAVGGDDLASGRSAAEAMASWPSVLSRLGPGDTLYVLAGDYGPAEISSGLASGTASDPIHVRAHPGHEGHVRLSAGLSAGSAMTFSGVDHWIVSGLRLSESTVGVEIESGRHLTLRRLEIDRTAEAGIRIADGSEGVTIDSCVIRSTGIGSPSLGFGIRVGSGSAIKESTVDLVIRNCEITSTASSAIAIGAPVEGVRVSECRIHSLVGALAGAVSAIEIGPGAASARSDSAVIVDQNHIYSVSGDALRLSHPGRVSNNLFDQVAGASLSFPAPPVIAGDASAWVIEVTHNTVFDASATDGVLSKQTTLEPRKSIDAASWPGKTIFAYNLLPAPFAELLGDNRISDPTVFVDAYSSAGLRDFRPADSALGVIDGATGSVESFDVYGSSRDAWPDYGAIEWGAHRAPQVAPLPGLAILWSSSSAEFHLEIEEGSTPLEELAIEVESLDPLRLGKAQIETFQRSGELGFRLVGPALTVGPVDLLVRVRDRDGSEVTQIVHILLEKRDSVAPIVSRGEVRITGRVSPDTVEVKVDGVVVPVRDDRIDVWVRPSGPTVSVTVRDEVGNITERQITLDRVRR